MSLSTILLGLLAINLLLFVHELGHYLAARAVGMDVVEFSVGMGPRLLRIRRGHTDYVLRLVPLAGYVLLPDLAPEEGAPVVSAYRRMIAMLAGPLANVLFAVLLVGPSDTLFLLGWWFTQMSDLFTKGGELIGVVAISDQVGQAALMGWRHLTVTSSFLSLNFAILNLLPIPGLDGGRLVSLMLEKLNGGRRPHWEPAVQAVGLLAILGLSVWLVGQDILRALGWIS
ncbi:MAG TPA: site-2 protease family protein [Symbiobacteriaceae bacterium]|nr:site-2 protease family protein [Symbiobacteriaceae bacterium]